jgi:predicted nucleic acid-binding Zn ribbon protein
MSEHYKGPEPLAVPLERLLRSLGTPGVAAVQSVFTDWPALVGDDVAAHCRPVSLDRGCLLVAVDDPGWATRFRYEQASLIGRFADVLGEGEITRIDVRVSPRSEP